MCIKKALQDNEKIRKMEWDVFYLYIPNAAELYKNENAVKTIQ